jgi:hypothetical protein
MYARAIALFMAVALSACAGRQPLKVDCDRRLVPINAPVQISKGGAGGQPARERLQ